MISLEPEYVGDEIDDIDVRMSAVSHAMYLDHGGDVSVMLSFASQIEAYMLGNPWPNDSPGERTPRPN